MKTLGAYGEIAKMSAALSGAVPQIAVVDGLCAGTAAMIACMADVVIMTEKSELFMTAPFTADDKTAGAGTAENAAKSGVAAILAKDSDEAIAKAKQLLSVLPANNLETAGNDYYMENDAAVSADLKGIELISSVADKESVIELYKQFGTSAVTAIGSLTSRAFQKHRRIVVYPSSPQQISGTAPWSRTSSHGFSFSPCCLPFYAGC